ncbi:MAG: ABC transporter permease [Firmicutes bacterium]|nr:ABC transporter permease [Bacillota bacterium]
MSLLLIWRQLKRNRMAMLGLLIVLIFTLAAIFAHWIAPDDPIAMNLRQSVEGPSAENLLGRDELGRDILSRLIYGARISLQLGLIAVGIGIAIGVPLGALSGYFGGAVDMIIQRMIDVMLAFPAMLLAIVLVSILGRSLNNAMIAIGIVSIPVYARLVRASTLTIKEMEYVQAAKALGQTDLGIIIHQILPNLLSPIIVQSTLQVASAILWAAGLGFLGLGAQAPDPEWGAMLSSGRDFIRHAPHVVIFPGLTIMATVLGLNLLGDGLRDALDPRMKL